jgi:hypothetical protein
VLDAGSYGHAKLMAYRIPEVIGYHGFELRRYDELTGKEDGYRNVFSPQLLELLAVRHLILPDTQSVPGFRLVVPKVMTTFGTPGALYERETPPQYARIMPRVGKVSADQTVSTLLDSRFAFDRIALLEDTATSPVPAATAPFPAPVATARVTAWEPGKMTVRIDGQETAASQLMIAENWYPDWRATVDGKPGTVRRVNHALLGIDLPVGAHEVQLEFLSPAYAKGKTISAVCLALTLLLIIAGLSLDRRARTTSGN